MDRHPGGLLQLRRVGDRGGAADRITGGIHGGHGVGLLGPAGIGRLCRCSTRLRGEGVGLRLQALAAAAKEKQPETHDATSVTECGPWCRSVSVCGTGHR
ncbi:hypothetical protein SGL43_01710 [Streptomyces globisporus]|uniref:Uncharacterized protein n=1 Tax=Streptomyces globisporus TaxID=1908 RepID=A0ABM9GTR0_STRGL|nr:hypothetical protein SGL43_01710 [Streptomyces globisporus]